MATVTIDDVHIALKDNDRKRAVQLLQTVLGKSPSPEAWYLAATLTSDQDKALKYLNQALLLNPKHKKSRLMLQKLGGTERSLLGTISEETADTVYQHSARLPIIRNLKPYQQLILAAIMVVLAVGVSVYSIANLLDTLRGPNVAAQAPEPVPVVMVTPEQIVDHLSANRIRLNGLKVTARDQMEEAYGHNIQFSLVDSTGTGYAVSIWVYDTISDLIADQTHINMQSVSAHVVGTTNAYMLYPKTMPDHLAQPLVAAFRSIVDG